MFKLPHHKKNNKRTKKTQEIRVAIAPIVDTVIVLGHQGLSFWGHRDNSKYHPEPAGYTKESVGTPTISCKGWGYKS